MSVTAASGFVAASGAIGIKASDATDLALVATADGRPVPAAAVFTQNLAAAAPVQVSRSHLATTGGMASAVLLTSGNANAATGEEGLRAALAMCQRAAQSIGSSPEEVLVCQTGLIGVPFPIDLVAPRVAAVLANRSAGEAAGAAAAEAIMTTDTVRKEAVAQGPVSASRASGAAVGTAHAGGLTGRFTVGGMAKGAAMLAPNMATMLAVLTTDAMAEPPVLRAVLADAVERSFNAITIDGCTSTNDTVVILASGRAGPVVEADLAVAVQEVCTSLARQMVADAEGATKVVTVRVAGAASDDEAHRAARRVADSLLVKCSFNGADPYWGRVVSELGSAGVDFDMKRVSVSYGGTPVCVGGMAAPHDSAQVQAHMAGRYVELVCDLGLGSGEAAILTADLGYGYIDENRTTS
ncbi:MAG: bifunctional glutamate N-acetyltransferase/amino-acid acetyltransferase ArgJ [Actinomycetota bacterium]|nr:bifunctional glutamate N-acetyltransferase/amino-acid acetyltransferase ArgJ [Actinomycetota bacterium]